MTPTRPTRPEVLVHPFGPVVRRDARVLVLGSMPGAASLQAGEYYAHPRNQFWDLMGDLFDAGRDLPYAKRLRRSKESRVALWDVVAECRRRGSLDADILATSVRANDFDGLFRRAPGIRAVFFNGGAAARLFARHVRVAPSLHLDTLPSTSPAHAARTREQKLRAWRVLLAWR